MSRIFKGHGFKELYENALRFSPDLQIQSVKYAEGFHHEIEREQTYSNEYVWFRVAFYCWKFGRELEENLGSVVQHDLCVYIEKMLRSMRISVDQCGEKIFSISQVSSQLNISTKTVGRYRSSGKITTRPYVDSSSGRLSNFITEKTLEWFVKKYHIELERAGNFHRLDEEEINKIMSRVRELRKITGNMTQLSLCKKIASEFQRNVETIRKLIVKDSQESRLS